MKRNFRFYFRIYYDYEMLPKPNTAVVSKILSTKRGNYNISATINLDNEVSKTAYSEINFNIASKKKLI